MSGFICESQDVVRSTTEAGKEWLCVDLKTVGDKLQLPSGLAAYQPLNVPEVLISPSALADMVHLSSRILVPSSTY